MLPAAITRKTAVLLAGGLFSLSVAAEEAADWLEKMSLALERSSYRGVLLREQDGESESLRVYHSIRDGVVRERIVAQEGTGFEIVRTGDEVICVLPDKKAVLVEQWDEGGSLFASLPRNPDVFGGAYDLAIEGQKRVAGRTALLLSIRPKDEMRFAHRVWLDEQTAFPLKTQLVDAAGKVLEQMRFADIAINTTIDEADLETSHDLGSFKWYPDPGARRTEPVDTEWRSDALPPGFAVEASHAESLSDSDSLLTHIVYSDGLSKVSVFIKSVSEDVPTVRSRVGGSHSFSTLVSGHQVTAVGEVPAATVEQIALSMRPPR